MSYLKCTLSGLMLIALAGCSTANKPDEQQQPPAAQEAAPEAAADVAAPEEAVPPAVQQPVPQVQAPKAVQQPARKTAAPRPAPAPAQAIQDAPATEAPAAQPAAVRPPEPRFATIPSGSNLHVRLDAPLDSSLNKTGETFRAIIDQDIVVDGRVIAPRGSIVEGRLTNVERSGRVEGRAAMSLQLTELLIENQSYPLDTGTLAFEAESSKKTDATKVGVGAGLGAVIGAIAGGGKGAAIGAAVGAGAGGATVIATRGKEVRLEAEQKLSFELRRDVSVRLR